MTGAAGLPGDILATIREPLLVLDPDLRVVLANRAFYRLFQVTPEETEGRLVYELGARQWDVPDLRRLLETVLPGNTAFDDYEVAAAFPGLGTRTMLLNARRVYGATGRTDLILLAIEDITDRRRAEEERARLAAIVANADDAILSVTLDGVILSWNAGAARLYGWTAEEAVGRHISLIVPPERMTELRSNLDRVGRGEHVVPTETELRSRDGGVAQVSLSASPIRDGAGRIAGVSVIARDIGDVKRAGEALRRAAEHLAHVTAVSPAVLYTLAAEEGALRPTWVSANITEHLGYTVEEALAADWWASRVHPEDRDAVVATVGTLFTRGRLSVEYRFLRRDGAEVWIRDHLRLIRDERGAPREVVGAWLDVTEARRAQVAFLQAQKQESIGRLASGVAHDFNNALTVIMGAAELASTGLREDDPLLRRLSQIRERAQRAAGLTRQLLAVARRQVFQPRVANLNDLVRELTGLLGRLLGEDIRLVLREGADLWHVRVDPTQVEQVILNLAVNSRDAMPGGGTITIETANVEVDEARAGQDLGVAPGPYVRLAVTDTGTGMDEATRRQAFEPFFTTKEPGRGTGLGLASVHGIVKQNGGGIRLDSEPGRGTTVEIFLPRALEPLGAAPAAPAAEFRRSTETILVVDDDEVVRQVVADGLRAAGYTPVVAATPDEAIMLASTHPGSLHLLLTDVVMPSMSGPDLARRIRAIRPDLRVLYISGYAARAAGQGALDPAATLLSKPFDFASLTRKVREVLDVPVP